jgi:hypothetical protein
MPSMDAHDAKVRSVLEAAGHTVEQQLPSIVWHVEGGPTRHYLLSLMLVFVDAQNPEDELAVIDVTCSQGPVLRWTIDATGRDGTFIAEETGLTDPDHARMAEDPDAASAAVEGFVGRTAGLVVESLTKSLR